MKNAKNNNGITLMALVITIIILIILASIGTYSGIQVVKSAQFTAFSTELKIMQTQVNKLYEEKKNGNSDVDVLGKTISGSTTVQTHATKAFNASGIIDTSDYKYFDTETIKSLNIEGVEGEFFVNIDKRSVVSYDGFEYEGKTYYTLEQLPDSLYNVEYSNDTTSSRPNFDLDVERLKKSEYKVSAKNINYEGNINNWNLEYKLDGQEEFKETKDLSVKLYEEGIYKIKIANGDFESEEKTVIIKEPQVGDYVNYDPTYLDAAKTQPVDSNKLTYISLQGTGQEHGNGYGTQTYKALSNVKWRVLNILSDDKIELISENIVKKQENEDNENFVLCGAIGYLYAEQELNEICKIYGYGHGADTTLISKYKIGGPHPGEETIQTMVGSGARSINVEDINKIAGIYETNENGIMKIKYRDGTDISSNYGVITNPTSNIYYPTITTITGKSESAGVKEIEYTLYSYRKSEIEGLSSIYDSLLFNKNYLLASRSIEVGKYSANFHVQRVTGNSKSSTNLISSNTSQFTDRDPNTSYGIRPIVTLKLNTIDYSNVSISTGENESAWQLK